MPGGLAGLTAVTDESAPQHDPAGSRNPTAQPGGAAAGDAGSGARPLRFGLAGTGHWARVAHARALAGTPGIEFTSVWGRNAEAAASLASAYSLAAYADFDAFLAGLDGVAFSLPPDVQSELAVRAAQAGKHLLLEKPLALTVAAGERLAAEIDAAGVASVVFFISRFQPEVRDWLADLAREGGLTGGDAIWLGTAHDDDNPFNSPWRQAKGGLWDLGPHVVSLLWEALGAVTSVTADAGAGDLTHLVLHHDGGVTSTATLTLGAPAAAGGFTLRLWGEHGQTRVPGLPADPTGPLRVALGELAANARSGQRGHPCDAHFALAVLRVLASAQNQLDRRAGVSRTSSPR
jgi:predicted dehydrogenase